MRREEIFTNKGRVRYFLPQKKQGYFRKTGIRILNKNPMLVK
jgi:hypothetical protein